MIEAIYNETTVESLNGNPLIESLSDNLLLDADSLFRKLYKPIEWNSLDNKTNHIIVMNEISKIRSIFIPLPIHLEIYNIIASMMISSYSNRNPMNAQVINERYIQSSGCYGGAEDFKTLLITGYSGLGKSRGIENIMRTLFPETILHTNYNGIQYSQIQIPYILCSISHDGSPKSLMYEILREIDKRVGSNYFNEAVNKRYTTANLTNLISKTCRLYEIGCLIIDELQMAYRNLHRLTNFLLKLVNDVKVPIIFISLPDIKEMVSDNQAVSRRLGTEGHIKLKPFKKDTEYKYLLSQLFKYHLLDSKVQLSDALCNIFYEKTGGNTDLTIRLYTKVLQDSHLKNKNKNKFTVSDVERIFTNEFELLSDMVADMKATNVSEKTEVINNDESKVIKRKINIKDMKIISEKLLTKKSYSDYQAGNMIDELEWCFK